MGAVAQQDALETASPLFVRLSRCLPRLAGLFPPKFARSPRYPLCCKRSGKWLDDSKPAPDRNQPFGFWSSIACDRNLLRCPVFAFVCAECAKSVLLESPRTLSRSLPPHSEVVVLFWRHQFSLDGPIELSVGPCESAKPSLSRLHTDRYPVRDLHCCYEPVDWGPSVAIPARRAARKKFLIRHRPRAWVCARSFRSTAGVDKLFASSYHPA